MNFNLNAAKALLGAAVVAGAVTAISQPASAISFNTGGTTVSGNGQISSKSGVTTLDFDNPSSISYSGGNVVSGSISGKYAAPPDDLTKYLTVGSGIDAGSGSATIALGGLKGYFGLFVSSIDSYNSIEFLKANVRQALFGEGGTALSPNPTGDQSVGQYYNFFGDNNSDLFDKVVLRSSRAALEVDNIATRTAIPTPALLPGLIGMGVAAWRKRRGESAQSEA